MEEKDYSLLRPFDLEAANTGYPVVTYTEPDLHGRLVLKPDENGSVVINRVLYGYSIWRTSELRMAPLCWVEGKPVYKGDILYIKDVSNVKYCVDAFNSNNITFCASGSRIELHISKFTWNPPKTKRKGWVNLYKISYDVCTGKVFETKEDALKQTSISSARIATIQIEWEE